MAEFFIFEYFTLYMFDMLWRLYHRKILNWLPESNFYIQSDCTHVYNRTLQIMTSRRVALIGLEILTFQELHSWIFGECTLLFSVVNVCVWGGGVLIIWSALQTWIILAFKRRVMVQCFEKNNFVCNDGFYENNDNYWDRKRDWLYLLCVN